MSLALDISHLFYCKNIFLVFLSKTSRSLKGKIFPEGLKEIKKQKSNVCGVFCLFVFFTDSDVGFLQSRSLGKDMAAPMAPS